MAAAAKPAEKTAAEKLREPFPPALIGKLPKGGAMLDFVGHAAVTDRLLQVDPEWTWEPLAVDDIGLPAFDRHNNLWIKLTVAGHTRIGVGDGKNVKECIGDAIRNAAMRFGVALDLWAKEDLHAFSVAADPAPVAAEQKNAESVYTAEDIDKLIELVEERGGDAAKTRAAAYTARDRGKLDTWLPNAMKHWEGQPVASEFALKAADAIVAGDAAQTARAAQAEADRAAATTPKAAA